MPEPRYPGVYIEEVIDSVHSIVGVPTSTAAFVGSTAIGLADQATRVRSFADFGRLFGAAPETTPMESAVRLFFLNGGTEALVVRASGRPVPEMDDGTGLYAIGTDEPFDLLCLPDLGVDPPSGAPPEVGDIAAQLAAASWLCYARRTLLIVDPLPTWHTAADVAAEHGGIAALASGMGGENAAVYFPPLLGSADGRPTREMPPSGAVAGIMARTDATRGVWKAPAGQEADVRGADDLAVAVSEADAEALSDHGVNPIRTFPGTGPVVWGARTLAGATSAEPSEWKYVPVRRMALFIERSIDEGLGWAVFEPNDERLWAVIRTSVGDFLHGLFRAGAFQGATPREAYFVKCDQETTTQNDLDAGVVQVLVGFAMLRPAEFTVIRIGHSAGRPP